MNGRSVSFTLAGRHFELTPKYVRARTSGSAPEQMKLCWVEIDGVHWPVKQVVAQSTGLSRTDFQSQSSRRILTGLGFTVGRTVSDCESTPSV